MQFILKLNRDLHALYNQAQVKLAATLRENLIQVKFGYPAEFLRQELRHLPLIREDVECGTCPLGRLFKDSFKPGKSSSSIVKA